MAFGKIGVQERDVAPAIDVRGDRDEVGLRFLRLLLEADDPIVAVELDDAVLAHELALRVLVDGYCAAVLPPPEVDVVREAEVEKVVARDDEHVLAVPVLSVGDDGDVADGAETG